MEKAKSILRKGKRVANRIFGTRVDEYYWKFRHVFDKRWAESYISQISINHSHRKILIDIISKYFPFEKVLEIGCASGPDLYLLAKKFPTVKFYGIDISNEAIKTGREYFKKENINNVFLDSGKAEELSRFNKKSMDIIFTDATLIYEGPDKISSIIEKIIQISKKAVILCEQHTNSNSSYYKDHWVHNYKLLFNKFVPEGKIKITKITPAVWEGDWGKLGYIIEAVL